MTTRPPNSVPAPKGTPRWIIPRLIRGLELPSSSATATSEVAEEPMRTSVDLLPPGASLGHFVVRHYLGIDASSAYYIVRHGSSGHERVARVLKRSALAAAPKLGDRMICAASAMVGVVSPYLIEIHGVGVTDEDTPRPYVIHERLVGRDLATYMRRRRQLPWPLALEIGRHCAAGLGSLHQLGWTHGDLRLASVMLVSVHGDGYQAKLLGFDRAGRLDRLGPPGVDGDLCALGGLIYQMITGTSPREVEPRLGVLPGERQPSTPRPLHLDEAGLGVPPPVVALIAALTDPRSAARPASADQVIARIEAILAQEGQSEGSTVGMLRRRVSQAVTRVASFGQRSLGQRPIELRPPSLPSPLQVAGLPPIFRALTAGVLFSALAAAFVGPSVTPVGDPRDESELVASARTLGVQIIPDAIGRATEVPETCPPCDRPRSRRPQVHPRRSPLPEALEVPPPTLAPLVQPKSGDTPPEAAEPLSSEELLPMIGIAIRPEPEPA